jgi:hypothetical protein
MTTIDTFVDLNNPDDRLISVLLVHWRRESLSGETRKQGNEELFRFDRLGQMPVHS